MFNAPNPGNEGRREWEDRRREEKREKKGGVRQVMTSSDSSYSLLSICYGRTGQECTGGEARNWEWREGESANGEEDQCFRGNVSLPGLKAGKCLYYKRAIVQVHNTSSKYIFMCMNVGMHGDKWYFENTDTAK